MKNRLISLCVKTLIVLSVMYISPAKLTSTGFQNIIINDVTTSIDISTQLVNVEYNLYFVSTDNDVRFLIFTIDPLLIDSVSYISAQGKIVAANNPLVKSQNEGMWKVFFQQPMIKGQREHITIFAVYTHLLKSYPKEIKQNDKHLVIFSGPISLYSPYLSLNQTSYVTMGNGSVERIEKPIDFELNKVSQLLIFKSNVPIKPTVKRHCLIHYEHKIPFLNIIQLHRTIEISHWGSIRVVEEIYLQNSGAKLNGPYHRHFPNDVGSNNIKILSTILPASATDISIYDDLGIISSFKTEIREDCIKLELYLRFLLYGGWKTKYFITYNVPTYEYLFNNGYHYELKMRVIDHIFNDMVIDNAVVNIILPEGTEQFTLQTPYTVQHLNRSYHFSYLDRVGRPVLSFAKENLVEQHIQDFVLTYKFNKLKMFFEPFYVVLFIQIIFVIIIIFGRLNLTITKEDAKETFKPNSGVKVCFSKPITVKGKKKKH